MVKSAFAFFVLLFFSVCASATTFSPDHYPGKIIYLDFWASWCGPCRQSFPWMNELSAKHTKDLAVVAVNLDQEKNLAAEFIRELNPTFEILFDSQGTLAETFGVSAMPTSFLIDRNGKTRFTHRGFTQTTKAATEAEINSLLNE